MNEFKSLWDLARFFFFDKSLHKVGDILESQFFAEGLVMWFYWFGVLLVPFGFSFPKIYTCFFRWGQSSGVNCLLSSVIPTAFLLSGLHVHWIYSRVGKTNLWHTLLWENVREFTPNNSRGGPLGIQLWCGGGIYYWSWGGRPAHLVLIWQHQLLLSNATHTAWSPGFSEEGQW